MRERFILKEDDDSIIKVDTSEITSDIVPEEEIKPEQDKSAIYQMLSSLIKDEWEAIDGYKSVIATLKTMSGYEDIIKVLEDIFPEELVHVGQLEKVMELVTPQAAEISGGKEEAAEQINESKEKVEESYKKHRVHKMNEEFKYSGEKYPDYMAYWMDEAFGEIDWLISDGDDEEYDIQKLRMLNDDGIEKLCYDCAEGITNSDYLWEQINEHIHDFIHENLDDIFKQPEYKQESVEFELPLPKQDGGEHNED